MKWTLYDMAGYSGKPTPLSPGIVRGKIYYENQFFPTEDHSQAPPMGARQAIASHAIAQGLPPGTPYCIDIEVWKTYTVGGGDTVALADAKVELQKYIDTLVTIKTLSPTLQWGYFGATLPMEDGFYAISKSPRDSDIRGAQYQKMVLQRKLAALCDILFPSCYTYSASEKEWLASFRLTMKMCRELSQSCRVLPFLWPQYVNGEQFIPATLWRAQLEACYEMAGGAVIWGKSATTWADAASADWWAETQAFVSEKGLAA